MFHTARASYDRDLINGLYPLQLIIKNTPHLGQSLLAGTLVANAVSFTRPRQERLDCLYLLR
jgi:hypothetical protein